jgi:hypothetical protein
MPNHYHLQLETPQANLSSVGRGAGNGLENAAQSDFVTRIEGLYGSDDEPAERTSSTNPSSCTQPFLARGYLRFVRPLAVEVGKTREVKYSLWTAAWPWSAFASSVCSFSATSLTCGRRRNDECVPGTRRISRLCSAYPVQPRSGRCSNPSTVYSALKTAMRPGKRLGR